MAEQNRKPPPCRSRQLRPGHDRCGRCLLHGAPSPNGPSRATLPGQVWVALSPKVAVQTFLREWMENSFNRLKDLRRLSLRLDKTDTSFRGFLAFAAAILNWRLKVRLCAQAQARQ